MINNTNQLDDAEIEKLQFLQRYINISNNDLNRIHEKQSALRAVGCSEKEIDEICKPVELDREEVFRAVRETSEREQRALRREHLRTRKHERLPGIDSGHQVQRGEIVFMD